VTPLIAARQLAAHDLRHDDDPIAGGLLIERSTHELTEMEGALLHKMTDGRLEETERRQLECVEREINRRWALR
jgi:hypothetical protein